MTVHEHRYRGTSPFLDREIDRRTFFGRDRELRSLESLVLSEDLVVLFARSGMGKSSLLNAGLVHRLRRRGYLPLTTRVDDFKRGPVASVIERARDVAADAQVDILTAKAPETLRGFFHDAEFWSPDDELLRPVLILDQFEELFTLHEPAARREFIAEFASLVQAVARKQSGRRLKIILSLREEFLADLEELAAQVPGILGNRFRLRPLTREGARQAIVEPAQLRDDKFETAEFAYREEAVDAILEFLAKTRRGSRFVMKDAIEPVQLQLICQHLESLILDRQREDSGPNEVLGGDVNDDERMRQVLRDFYRATLDKVGDRKARKAVHILCEERLISASGRRLNRSEEEIVQTEKIPLETLHLLVDERLLRSEPRLGGTFYELSHDTLVEPILETRAAFRRRRRSQRYWMLGAAAMVIGFVLFFLRANELAAQEILLAEADDIAAVERLLRVAPAWPRRHNDTEELAATRGEAVAANGDWSSEAGQLLERIAEIYEPRLARQEELQLDRERVVRLESFVAQGALLEDWLIRVAERRPILEETPFELWQCWQDDADSVGDLIAEAPIWPPGDEPRAERDPWEARCANLLGRMDGYAALADRLPNSDRRERIRALVARRNQLQLRELIYGSAPWRDLVPGEEPGGLNLAWDDQESDHLIERGPIFAYVGPEVAAGMLSQVESIVDYLGAYTELAAALPSEPQIDFALAGLQTSPTLIEELEATRADWQQAGIAAQVGLVPIGRDPASGRWEFWLPISGERPERDEDGQLQLTAGSGLVFVLIPPGTFPMGSKAGKPEEQPVREVGLDGFFLSKFELTRAQWARLVGAEPIVDTALLPAQASWAAVHGQLTKWHLELPSEAQWEYACRAGTVTPWSIPEGAELADYAWFAERGAEGVGEERPSPEPVGQKLPNPWGLHDVHGNVSEWCSDGYHPRFYETSSTNVRNPLMPFQRTRDRVSRGGAVNEVASAQRSAARHAYLARSRRVANSVAFEPGIRPMFRLRDSLPSIWDRLSPRMLTSAKRVLPKQRAELARLLAKRPALERTLAELQVVAVASERSPRLWREIGIPPQVGLIPLGRDAKSQRWEFWVPSTGKRPDWVDGHVVPNDEMAVVMVLVPEPEPDGVFLMGSQDDDASKPNYVEGTAPFAVHPVKLSRFFISKFEMTARQWATLRRKELKAGSNGRLPITGVNWEECNRALVTAGLQLPTESQWEYACRAGTTGKYWFDASLARQRFAAPGAKKPRPVGMNSPNPFGLHDVHGNVHEWCRDWFAPYGAGNAPRPGDGLRPARGTRRVSRGGGFVHAGAFHRAATFRGNAPPSLREVEHGFRPARPVVEVAPKTLLAAEPLHDRVEESRALIADAERFWLGAVDSRKSRVWCERADVLLDQLTGVSELARALPAGPLLEEIQGLREVRMSLGRLRRLVPEIVAAAPMWEAARRDLAKDRRFAGFELEPIAYLLPLGKNASTGLWEFWAPETGAKPEWSKDPLPNAPEGSSANTLMSPESALVFVLVPGGKFQMGQSDAAPNPSRGVSIGRPRHEVTVKPFLVSKFEVTQAQWLRGLAPEAAGAPRTAAPRGGRTRRGRYGSSRNLAALPATIDPVVNVRAPDCRRFCDRFQLSLPSEAQWEYFCRAGTTTPWSIPDGAKLTDYAWFDVRATAAMSKPRRAPAPIGQKLPNPWGLHDVHGNVWEWCLDAWNPEYPNEPTDASPRWGGSGHLQIHRGGGFRNPLPECRSDARAANDAERASFPDVGLRPVLDPTRRRRLAGVRTGFVATAPSKLVGMRGPSRDSDPAPLYRVGEPVDRVLIGVSGNHGMFIDSIQPIYRVLTRDGLGKEFRGDRIGGRGGSGPTVLKAPRDWVVTGVEVRVGGEIQAMRLIYSPWRDLQSAKRATQRSKWIADPRRRGARPFELVGAAGEFVAGFAVTTSPSQGGWLRTLEVAKGRKGR